MTFQFTDEHINPFVIEALLFCKDENISVMVRHTGKYTINEINLNTIPNGAILEEKNFLPHKLGV